MAEEREHIVLTFYAMHIIAEAQGVHLHRHIAEQTDDIVLETVKIHCDVLAQALEGVCARPIALKRPALEGTHHSVWVVDGLFSTYFISVITFIYVFAHVLLQRSSYSSKHFLSFRFRKNPGLKSRILSSCPSECRSVAMKLYMP